MVAQRNRIYQLCLHRNVDDAVFRTGGRDLPHAVILMVGGNDLDKCGVAPQFVGMEIFTLACDLVSCGVNHVTVCQVLRRNSWRHFSYQEGANRVSGINEFLLDLLT